MFMAWQEPSGLYYWVLLILIWHGMFSNALLSFNQKVFKTQLGIPEYSTSIADFSY